MNTRGFAVSLVLSSLVTAQKARVVTVDVLGEVSKNQVTAKRGLTVLEAVIMSRPKPDAAMDLVVILRTAGLDVLVLEVDVGAMLRAGDTKTNVVLETGDIVAIPAKDAQHERQRRHRRLFSVLAAVDDSKLDTARRIRLLAWRLEMDHDAKRCLRVIAELGLLGEKATAAVPHLHKALDGKPRIAGEAATTPGMIGVSAKPALPALSLLSTHEEPALRARARATVRQITKALAAQ